MLKIVTVVGARPQFIKAAVVNRAIKKYNHDGNRIEEVIIHTGQHYDSNMSDVFFSELQMDLPKYNLNVGKKYREKITPALQISDMLIGLENVINIEKPDLVLLYGDTNSTLAGAIIASKLKIPIAHIEAGVRLYDMYNVEEQNRIMTDHMSQYLFCPTSFSIECLEKEGIIHQCKKRNTMINVYNTGDVMFDAYLFEYDKCCNLYSLFQKYELKEDNYILLTIHRDENVNPHRLKQIFSGLELYGHKILFPVHPRTRKMIEAYNINLSDNIFCVEPIGYHEMLFLQKNACMIITDSGGVQKEAYFSKVPCLTLLEETGWVETVQTGWNRLLGEKSDFSQFIDFKPQESDYNSQLFGNGHAGEEIVSILKRII